MVVQFVTDAEYVLQRAEVLYDVVLNTLASLEPQLIVQALSSAGQSTEYRESLLAA
ncbi:hypothetical protein ACPWR0_07485 [Pandoraea pneumonica]|uniref:hypothetical protein n=1 Tax=Pandoraea pneumonica TaxID=2508299 RepID=UPI003CED2D36